MNHLPRLSVVLVSGVVSAGAQAQSDGEAQISNVTFQLIDLDPADGIAPSLTFNTDAQGPTAGWEIYDEHSGSLTGDTRIGSAPLGPVSVAQSHVDEPHTRSDLSAGISGVALADKQLWARASMRDTVGANASTAYVQSGNAWFVLSPQTRVTLSADLSVRTSAGPVAAPGLHAIGSAWAALGLYSSRDNVWQSAPLYHNAVFGEDRGPGWDATYSLSFSNSLASAGDYAFGLNVGATAYTSSVIPMPVPEPASLAMLIAGLGLVAAAPICAPTAARAKTRTQASGQPESSS